MLLKWQANEWACRLDKLHVHFGRIWDRTSRLIACAQSQSLAELTSSFLLYMEEEESYWIWTEGRRKHTGITPHLTQYICKGAEAEEARSFSRGSPGWWPGEAWKWKFLGFPVMKGGRGKLTPRKGMRRYQDNHLFSYLSACSQGKPLKPHSDHSPYLFISGASGCCAREAHPARALFLPTSQSSFHSPAVCLFDVLYFTDHIEILLW